MKKTMRLALLMFAGLASTVFAGNALAAYNPTMLVAQQGTNTTIRVRVALQDEPTARVALYVPLGYQATLTQAPNATIGQVVAEANARAISPEARLPLTGTIVAVTPTPTNPCTGTRPTAQWELRLTAAGQTLTIPAYVDRVTTGPEATFASHRIVFCLQPQSQAQFQAKLLEARLTLQGVFTAPATPAQQVWSGIFTPYVGTSATVNRAGTVEAQSIVRQSRAVSLQVRQVGPRVFRLTGRVTEAGVPAAGIRVQILRGGSSRRVGRYLLRVFATKTTSAAGTFSHQVRFRARGWVRFRVRAVAPAPNPAAQAAMDQARTVACVSPKPATIAPAGCTNAKILGFTVASGITRPYRIR